MSETRSRPTLIRVRGDCGHVWEARTTKARFIVAGVTDLPGLTRRVRLYCPECYRERGREWAHSHPQPVVPVGGDGKRRCACGAILSRYNDSDTCRPCQGREVAA